MALSVSKDILIRKAMRLTTCGCPNSVLLLSKPGSCRMAASPSPRSARKDSAQPVRLQKIRSPTALTIRRGDSVAAVTWDNVPLCETHWQEREKMQLGSDQLFRHRTAIDSLER